MDKDYLIEAAEHIAEARWNLVYGISDVGKREGDPLTPEEGMAWLLEGGFSQIPLPKLNPKPKSAGWQEEGNVDQPVVMSFVPDTLADTSRRLHFAQKALGIALHNRNGFWQVLDVHHLLFTPQTNDAGAYILHLYVVLLHEKVYGLNSNVYFIEMEGKGDGSAPVVAQSKPT